LVVFDWDGTLMDSERQIVHCMQAAAADLDLVVPMYCEVRSIIGLGLPEAIQVLFPGHEAGLRERVRQCYAGHFIAGAGGRSELFPGAPELLDRLHANGQLMAVATGKSRAGLDRVLCESGLSGYFHITRCADETASKPDPLMLHEILGALSVPADEVVMIGDTTFDLEMAARAGIRSIGVGHGAHDVEVLERYSPMAIVPDLKALLPYLASL
jgi:phosphoglycolate phosphatase